MSNTPGLEQQGFADGPLGLKELEDSMERRSLILVQCLMLTALPSLLIGKSEPRQVKEFDVPAKVLFKTALHIAHADYVVTYADHESMAFNFRTRGIRKFQAQAMVEPGEAGKSVLKVWVGGKFGLANIGKADRIAKEFVEAIAKELRTPPAQHDKSQEMGGEGEWRVAPSVRSRPSQGFGESPLRQI
jgi:hypothetical protein